MSDVLTIERPVPTFDDRLGALENELRAVRRSLADLGQVAHQIRQLVGPFGVPVSPDELLVQTLYGVKFIVPAADRIMTPQLIVYRQWEAQLSRLLPWLAPAGSVFVDVGANFGYFTCLVAEAMGVTPGSRVIAIEPNPAMLRLLAVNIGINWSMAPVQIVAGAVAEAPGTATLHVPVSRAANATLAHGGDAARNDTIPVDVTVSRLDDLLRDEARVDLLKIDVEGFEPAVLRGAATTLARPGLRVICEWAPAQMRFAGFDPAEVLATLRGHGFQLFDAETYLESGSAAMLSDPTLMALSYGNLLALRD